SSRLSPPVRRLPGGLRSVARYAGLCPFSYLPPRFADSPGACDLSPAMGARVDSRFFPPVRRLTGGLRSVARYAGSCRFSYLHPRFADSPGASDLSPAMRARVDSRIFTPGSQTHRGLAICRPLCGLVSILVSSPPVRRLTGG